MPVHKGKPDPEAHCTISESFTDTYKTTALPSLFEITSTWLSIPTEKQWFSRVHQLRSKLFTFGLFRLTLRVWAQSTQDAGRDAHANLNIFPLMLLACSVDTPIHINRSRLLALHCASPPTSCVDWALGSGNRSQNLRLAPRIGTFGSHRLGSCSRFELH